MKSDEIALRVKVIRAADVPIGVQLEEMRCWLDDQKIQATDLVSQIVKGRAIFEANFRNSMDADRFIRAFGDLGWRKYG